MALVDSWKFWAEKNGYWYPIENLTPQRGDIVVFSWKKSELNHIGIVRGYTPQKDEIETSEGNHSHEHKSGNFSQNMKFVVGLIRIG